MCSEYKDRRLAYAFKGLVNADCQNRKAMFANGIVNCVCLNNVRIETHAFRIRLQRTYKSRLFRIEACLLNTETYVPNTPSKDLQIKIVRIETHAFRIRLQRTYKSRLSE